MRSYGGAVLILAAGTEVITGLVLIIAPAFFTHLLFGGELSAPGIGLGPLAGFALLALAWVCWPSAKPGWPAGKALQAFLLFSLLSAVYLAYRGLSETVGKGVLLWPAAFFHAVLAVLLAVTWFRRAHDDLPTYK